MFENPLLGYLGLGATALGGALGFMESKSAEKILGEFTSLFKGFS